MGKLMYDLKTFQDELNAIGGFNLRGEPILRVVRGDQAMKFACGQIIPKYFVPGGAQVEIEKRFRKRHIFNSSQVESCTRDEALEIWNRSQEHDLTNHWMPETYDKITVTPTARTGYFIEQWYSPEKIQDTPEQWEKNRYQMFSIHETRPQRMTDMVGPFPYEGVYENFAEGEELTSELLESVRRAWKRRNEWRQVKSDELMVRDVFKAHQAKADEDESTADQMLRNAILPHVYNGVYMNTPSKFIHQAEGDFHVE